MVKRNEHYRGDRYTVSIARTVAEKEGVEPEELPPLYDVVDPSHLERLIETATGSVSVEFRYCGYHIRIDGDGTLRVDDDVDTHPDAGISSSRLS